MLVGSAFLLYGGCG